VQAQQGAAWPGKIGSAARRIAARDAETRNLSEVSAKGKEKSHDFSLALHFHHYNDKSTTTTIERL